jgi:hypothetical protein
MRIDSKSTVTHVNAADLLDRLDERIAKLQPGAAPQLIEVAPDDAADDADADDGAGDEPPDDDSPDSEQA